MILFLVHLAGAAALLLWAVRLIRTGVERAFMAQLRTALRRSERNRALGAAAGAGAAMLLQSSTAVALLVVGFVMSAGLAAATGLTLVLGADLGSAIAVQILMLRASWLVPLLLVLGTVLFLRGRRRAIRQSGRVLTGLALVFVSIDMMRQATAPLQDSYLVGLIVSYLDSDALTAFVLGAMLAYLVQSSLAAVLMFATFAATGMLSAQAGVALVLGANLGGAVIPFILTLSKPVEARRVVVANLILRGGGALLALVALAVWTPDLSVFGAGAHTRILNLHLAFNLAVLLVGLVLARPVTDLVASAMPEISGTPVTGATSALDDKALDDPERALACTSREVLRMGETVAAMLEPALRLYRQRDDATAAAILKAEDEVDRMHFETKLYIARLQEGVLTPDQSRRAMDLATIANNLEDAGDAIANNMLDMARRMHAEGLVFSDDGWSDLEDFHDCVSSNTQLALNVLMTGEAEVARQLLEEKDRIRQVEQRLQARHLDRLRSGAQESIETSNLHQETIRALKQVNTGVCWIAYPIAEEAGDLLSSRLAGADTSSKSGKPGKKRQNQREAKA